MATKGMLGTLKIRVIRGTDLVVRDLVTSDPYVVATLQGTTTTDQKVQTRVIRKNLNPEWNEELSLSITDPKIPIKLTVFDQDRFSKDDQMGEAMVDIQPCLECIKKGLEDLPVGTAVKKIQPSQSNDLAEESKVVWAGKGRMVQHMKLRLRNVVKGAIEVEIEWAHGGAAGRSGRHGSSRR